MNLGKSFIQINIYYNFILCYKMITVIMNLVRFEKNCNEDYRISDSGSLVLLRFTRSIELLVTIDSGDLHQ